MPRCLECRDIGEARRLVRREVAETCRFKRREADESRRLERREIVEALHLARRDVVEAHGIGVLLEPRRTASCDPSDVCRLERREVGEAYRRLGVDGGRDRHVLSWVFVVAAVLFAAVPFVEPWVVLLLRLVVLAAVRS